VDIFLSLNLSFFCMSVHLPPYLVFSVFVVQSLSTYVYQSVFPITFLFCSLCLSVFLYFCVFPIPFFSAVFVFLSFVFCLSVCLSFSLSYYFSLSFYLSVSLSLCLSVFLSLCLSYYLSFLLQVDFEFQQSAPAQNRMNWSLTDFLNEKKIKTSRGVTTLPNDMGRVFPIKGGLFKYRQTNRLVDKETNRKRD